MKIREFRMPKKALGSGGVFAFLLLGWLAPSGLAQVPFQLLVLSAGSTTLVGNNATLSFPANAVGGTYSITLTLTYQGTTSATVSAAQLFGSGFSLGSGATSSADLQPGQATTFTVSYTAASAMQATGQLVIPYTEAGATPATSTLGTIAFTLSGTAPSLIITYALATNGNVVTITSGNTIAVPSTVVGSSSSVAMAIINQGSGDGSIQSIKLTGDPSFSLQETPLLPLTTLGPNTDVTFNVIYSPTQTGTNSGTLTIVFPTQTVTLGLQGTAIPSLLSYQLVQGTQMSALTPGQTLTFPNTDVGSMSSLTIQAQNTSSSAVTISGAAVSGTGYSITDEPILPVTMNVNQTESFTVTFTPTQAGAATGRFRIGNDSFNLTGTAIGVQLTYSYLSGSASNPVVPGGSVLFTPEAVGQSESSTFTIQNTGTTTATITSIGVSNSATTPVFTASGLPQLPLSLAAGQSAQFTVVFAPQTTGLSTAVLMVNAEQFTLSGFGNAPPAIPSFQFTGASGAQTAMSQVSVGLTLASAYSLELTGTLTLSVNSGNLPADPSVQFASGGQTVNFTIPQGSTQAVFPSGGNQISLQTGSVESTITLTPSFALPSGLNVTPASPATATLSVPAGPAQLLNALVSAETPSANSLTLTVSGYATDRTLTSLQFQFTAQSGSSLANSAVTVNIQPNALAWFSSAQSDSFGGQFSVSVPFTITSGTSSTSTTTSLLSQLESVSITASNDQGTSSAVSVSLAQ
jgi:hypothetical protein